MYLYFANPKAQEVGRLMFFALLIALAPSTVHLLHG